MELLCETLNQVHAFPLVASMHTSQYSEVKNISMAEFFGFMVYIFMYVFNIEVMYAVAILWFVC